MADDKKNTLTGNNARLRAGKLTNEIRRHAAYRAQVAAQTEQRIRKAQFELEELGFDAVEVEPLDVSELTDEALEALATGALPEA